eukprot:354977-Chlamydomonas_euryale.AAC.3
MLRPPTPNPNQPPTHPKRTPPMRHWCTATQGAKKQGIAEHIKVKKKFDAMGVGAVSEGEGKGGA